MELIPPENQQNLNPNPVNPDTSPETSNQTENQPQQNAEGTPEAPTSAAYKIFDFVRASIFELFLVALFSILILTTFNYFNLIPLSSVFPTLSFLPQENNIHNELVSGTSETLNANLQNLSTCNSVVDKNIVLNYLVTCQNPLIVKNNTQQEIIQDIPNSSTSPNASVQINFSIQIKLNSTTKNNKSFTSGILINNDSTKNQIFIFYYPYTHTWLAEFVYSNSSKEFDNLYTTTISSIQNGNFSLTISEDGKTLSVLLPNGIMDIFNLKESLYSKSGTISFSSAVPPRSSLTVYSFNYYVPQ